MISTVTNGVLARSFISPHTLELYRRVSMSFAPSAKRAAAVNASKTLLIAVFVVAAVAGCSPRRPPYVPQNPELAKLHVFFYPSRTATPARAVIFFFGNDIGFWTPHQDLAEYLSGLGYSVVGFDMRSFLADLPDPQRDSAFHARILPLIASTRHELHADNLPLIIAGHSLGAEVAIWTAAFTNPPEMVGVIAMSPGLRSHLQITASDLLNGDDPTGPGSFSVPATLHTIAPDVRVAIVRGSKDHYRYADSALIVAGGNRIHSYIVPFASHSLKRIIVAKPVMRQAVDWLLDSAAGRRAAASETTSGSAVGSGSRK
jgi:pimeloyl-ACP methyl ester carboxylesterase